MSTQKSSTLPSSGNELTNETSDFTLEEGYKARELDPNEIHANWGVILPLLQDVDHHEWNGTYAKLLKGDCRAVLVENNGKAVIIAIITIGKHGATSGLNTCFVDALGVNKESGSVTDAMKVGLKFVCELAKAASCDGLLAETPNKAIADMSKNLGFHVTPMFKLGRYV